MKKHGITKGVSLGNLGRHEEAIEPLTKSYNLLKQLSGENIVLKPAKRLGEGDELRVIETSPTDTKWVRVALVQIDFQLSFNKPPNEFGYELLKKEQVKSKVFKALEAASRNKANIICFPELSVDEEWLDEAKNL